MKKIKNVIFHIAPQHQEKNMRYFWSIGLTLMALFFSMAYFTESAEFKMYGYSAAALFVLIYFQSVMNRKFGEQQGWPSVCLVDGKLQIKQESSLLWSKNIEQILSAKIEHKTFLIFSSKALLIKSEDGDSYYLEIPRPYSEAEPAESIADAINERVNKRTSVE